MRVNAIGPIMPIGINVAVIERRQRVTAAHGIFESKIISLFPAPRFGHLPLVVEPDGSKLSKSRGAQAVSGWPPGEALERILTLLGYSPPAGLRHEPVPRILDWALSGWPPAGLAGRRAIALAT